MRIQQRLVGLGLLGTLCACGSSSQEASPISGPAIAGSAAAPPTPGAVTPPPLATPTSPSTGTAPGTPPSSAPPAVTPTPAMTPAAAPPTPAMMPAAPSMPMHGDLAMDECGLKTKYPGDEYCIKVPEADKGFQLHIGPTDYENVDAKYILRAGEERTDNFATTSTNDQKQFFLYRQFRMRPGAHHNIITVSAGGSSIDVGRRIGTSNHLAEDSPVGNIIAPENKGVGIPIDAKSSINVSLHSINTTEGPMLREVWINFWYRDASEVTEPAEEMFQTGGIGGTTFAIQPHQDTVLGPFTCNIQGNGRMLWFYGHRHANNVRFTATRIRAGERKVFYEGYNWEDPMVLEYSTTVTNPIYDRPMKIDGGHTGILDFKSGDTIEWECHIVNKTDGVLRFSNNTYTGEMCIMDAELVGANCPAGL